MRLAAKTLTLKTGLVDEEDQVGLLWCELEITLLEGAKRDGGCLDRVKLA